MQTILLFALWHKPEKGVPAVRSGFGNGRNNRLEHFTELASALRHRRQVCICGMLPTEIPGAKAVARVSLNLTYCTTNVSSDSRSMYAAPFCITLLHTSQEGDKKRLTAPQA